MENEVDKIVKAMEEHLVATIEKWVDANQHILSERRKKRILKELKSLKKERKEITNVMALALWIHNLISGFGVFAGLSPGKVSLHYINPNLDKDATIKLLQACANALTLQYLG